MRTHDDPPLADPFANDPIDGPATHTAEIRVDENGLGFLAIDGVKVPATRSFTFESRAGERPVLTVERFLTAGVLNLKDIPVHEVVICPSCRANTWRNYPTVMLYNVLSQALFNSPNRSVDPSEGFTNLAIAELGLTVEDIDALKELPLWDDLPRDVQSVWSATLGTLIRQILTAVAIRRVVTDAAPQQ